jgi:hypothetical protein
MQSKKLKPASSYELALPENVREQSDGRVSSFWLDGQPLLLQLSSYVRIEGAQVGASARLRARILKHPGAWQVWKSSIYPDPSVDQATAEFTDANEVLWVHTYLVWPHLTIYATISGPRELVKDQNNWLLKSLKGLRLVTH